MKLTLVAVWLLLPCNSPVAVDHTSNTTLVISCPYTFGEVYGPFLPQGWVAPKIEKKQVVKKRKTYKPKHKYKRKRHRRK